MTELLSQFGLSYPSIVTYSCVVFLICITMTCIIEARYKPEVLLLHIFLALWIMLTFALFAFKILGVDIPFYVCVTPFVQVVFFVKSMILFDFVKYIIHGYR